METIQIVLASRPVGIPAEQNFRTEKIELPPLQDGWVLLQGEYYSVDPYMRSKMNEAKSYTPPFEVDKPMYGGVVAKVLESKATEFNPGDLVFGGLPWSKLIIANANAVRKIDISFVPSSYYLGILGMTGITAYIGLMDIGKPKPGETVVVSGAAGAVGMIVGQIAKIQGCYVIGIAGSDEKIKMLKDEYGFDEAINYKTTPDLKAAIAALCPNGIDIYFDNVGGPVSDAVVSNINFHARIALCGQISLYNSTEIPIGPRWQSMLLTRSVIMQGFIVSNYSSRFAEVMEHLSQWVKEGKLKTTETIEHGFDKLPSALIGLFKGENTGKMIVAA